MAPRESRPVVYMLCGFVGSGKTTYARTLEAERVVRLSIDELIFERRGQHGIDYDEGAYPAHHAAALAELDQRLSELIAGGRSVALDYGFWSQDVRERYKRRIEDAGGIWRLLYFKVDREEIRRRLAQRNRQGGANALVVTDRHLDEFEARWQPPADEGEEVIQPQI